MTTRFRDSMALRFGGLVVLLSAGLVLAAQTLDGPALYAVLAILLGAGLGVVIALSRRSAEPLERLARLARATGSGGRAAGSSEIEVVSGALTHLGTTLRHVESARERETAQLRRVLETMVEGVLVIGSDGRIGLENAALRRLLGAPSPLSGRTPVEALRSPEFGAAVDRVVRDGKALALEITLPGPADQGVRPADVPVSRVLGITLAPLKFEDGDGVVAVLHDITRIRELENVRKDFVANVSHELRTPLAAIKGYVETLCDHDLPAADRERFLNTVARHTDRLSGLIEDLLELSRLESPAARLDTKPLSLPEAVERAFQLTGEPAKTRGVELRESMPAGLPPVMADERSLEHILLNLIDNALKWTSPGGSITVSGEEREGQVRVVVEDTGAGIPPGDLPRIFERFYRVDRARTREQGGTGLGLAIVKRLVQMQAGEVGVESTVGKGSTFWFTLPAGSRPASGV